MLDWLARKPAEQPGIELAGHVLPIVIRRLSQARRMTLRLAPDGSEVRISIPRWGRTADALAFVELRRDWLEAQLAAIPRAGLGTTLPFRGEPHAILHDPAASRRVIAGDGALRVGGPAESLESRLRRWLEKEARTLNQPDLDRYCQRAGVATPPLALSGAQRRWGSCAANGSIRINWRLIMAPDFVRHSVIAHEVAHLIHFDHSPRFHAVLGEIYEGDIREANHWLKREGRGLYRWFG